jgi:hypothetical protein
MHCITFRIFLFKVRYTGYRDRPLHERQNKFLCAIRDGHAEVVRISFYYEIYVLHKILN